MLHHDAQTNRGGFKSDSCPWFNTLRSLSQRSRSLRPDASHCVRGGSQGKTPWRRPTRGLRGRSLEPFVLRLLDSKPRIVNQPIRKNLSNAERPRSSTSAPIGRAECDRHQHVEHGGDRSVHHDSADLGDVNGAAGLPGLAGRDHHRSGGLVVAELGAALPASGGTYVFLREGFGPGRWERMLAFLFVWQVLFAGPLEIATGNIGLVY